MGRRVTVHGKLRDATHVELDEPVGDLRGPVEVTLRSLTPGLGVVTPVPPNEWAVAFDSWTASHDPSLPVLPAEALRRESLYEDR